MLYYLQALISINTKWKFQNESICFISQTYFSRLKPKMKMQSNMDFSASNK